MRKHPYKIAILLFTFLALIACGGSDSGNDPAPPIGGGDDDNPTEIPAPSSATLVFPEDDTECNQGEIVNDTESTVTFQWNASQNTDSYSVTMTNLSTGSSFNTVANTNEASITILRGVPYEWFVTSRANGTNETSESTKWRFYNEGPGVENYAPFPAESVNPSRGATLPAATTTLTLVWTASDVDNDIVNYEIFFDLEGTSPSTSLGMTTESTFEVSVASGNNYQWSVKVIDSQNNTSTSETFLFRVDG
ncbi:hypothetical protein [uncultured Croceitalea sp.]|uniref:hypothetical protein n=1 Tax=uncultured Croceitalea sp. TaxID=1798908 RepID=UPI00330608CE